MWPLFWVNWSPCIDEYNVRSRWSRASGDSFLGISSLALRNQLSNAVQLFCWEPDVQQRHKHVLAQVLTQLPAGFIPSILKPISMMAAPQQPASAWDWHKVESFQSASARPCMLSWWDLSVDIGCVQSGWRFPTGWDQVICQALLVRES